MSRNSLLCSAHVGFVILRTPRVPCAPHYQTISAHHIAVLNDLRNTLSLPIRKRRNSSNPHPPQSIKTTAAQSRRRPKLDGGRRAVSISSSTFSSSGWYSSKSSSSASLGSVIVPTKSSASGWSVPAAVRDAVSCAYASWRWC